MAQRRRVLGVATAATVSVTGGSGGFGEFTATCAGGVNNAGLQAGPVSVHYNVTYTFTGFFQPIDMGVTNAAKAGRAIPVKFSLGGNFGLDIFAPGYPRTVLTQCITGQAIDQIEETVTAGGSSLSYDAVADQYIYVWKTDKSWGGSCRELQVKTADGATHSAQFTFSK